MDLVDVLPANGNAVDLQDLVSLVQEAAALGRAALHHAAHHHAVHVVTHRRALLAEAGVTSGNKNNVHVGRYRKGRERVKRQNPNNDNPADGW